MLCAVLYFAPVRGWCVQSDGNNVFFKCPVVNVFLRLILVSRPRAGINANDGFGGGDDISHNLVFSSCRESGDHGPFNRYAVTLCCDYCMTVLCLCAVHAYVLWCAVTVC